MPWGTLVFAFLLVLQLSIPFELNLMDRGLERLVAVFSPLLLLFIFL